VDTSRAGASGEVVSRTASASPPPPSAPPPPEAPSPPSLALSPRTRVGLIIALIGALLLFELAGDAREVACEGETLSASHLDVVVDSATGAATTRGRAGGRTTGRAGRTGACRPTTAARAGSGSASRGGSASPHGGPRICTNASATETGPFTWVPAPADDPTSVREKELRLQVPGCALQEMTIERARKCLKGRRVVFFGDSVTR
jgi:hypothetical protein